MELCDQIIRPKLRKRMHTSDIEVIVLLLKEVSYIWEIVSALLILALGGSCAIGA